MRTQSLLAFIAALAVLLASALPGKNSAQDLPPPPQTIRVGVLTIFHSQRLIITAINTPLVASAAGHTFFLQAQSQHDQVEVRFSDANNLLVRFAGKEFHADSLHSASRNNSAADFFLSIPGKFERRYRGTLDVTARDASLLPIVTLDLELAVATVVQSESPPDAAFEMLKAQAVATRSYFLAAPPRHKDFDFCDLTHCQTLRDLPAANSPAERAAKATQGEVLLYNGAPIPAMYTRSCSGHTLTPAQVAMPSTFYPFQSVRCEACSENPIRWTRKLSREDAAQLKPNDESSRLELCRRLGWNAVPSNTFESHPAGDEILLEGKGYGHGIGLCQRGAQALALQGVSYREILAHYFPGTQIAAENLPRR